MVNLVSTQFFTRLDFTENRIYSLSPAMKHLLGRLVDPVRIKVYFDETVPPEYLLQRRYLQELLGEMSTAARGRLRLEFADMRQAEMKEEARRAGITPLRFTAVREDKFELQEGMMGLVLYYEDKKEVVTAVTQIEDIEYDLAGRIMKLTRRTRPVLGWTTGNGELDPPESLTRYVTEHYELRRLDALGSAGRDTDLAALIVAGPKRLLSDTWLRAVDRAVISGVPTALLIDFYDVHMGNFFARKNEIGLEGLLKAYGVEMREGLVVDAQNVPVQIQSQQGFFMMQTVVNYPYIPRVTDLSREHAVTRSMQEISMPFSGALSVTDSSGVTVLARSSKESYRMAKPLFVNPTEQISIEGSEQGPYDLGVSIQGDRRGAYGDTTARGRVRLVVMANANFLDESRGGGTSNALFGANLIDWLAASEDLISIRSKTHTFRPLEKVSTQRRGLIKATCLFLMPISVLLLGLVRWQMRRLSRRRWQTAA